MGCVMLSSNVSPLAYIILYKAAFFDISHGYGNLALCVSDSDPLSNSTCIKLSYIAGEKILPTNVLLKKHF